jgi:hypothetical protein
VLGFPSRRGFDHERSWQDYEAVKRNQLSTREEIVLVNVASTYIHAIEGRLRIKVVDVKASSVKALELEELIRKWDGISHVNANPLTGNVLILFKPDTIGQAAIVGALQGLGYLRANGSTRTRMRGSVERRDGLSHTLLDTLVCSAMELALQRLVRALI